MSSRDTLKAIENLQKERLKERIAIGKGPVVTSRKAEASSNNTTSNKSNKKESPSNSTLKAIENLQKERRATRKTTSFFPAVEKSTVGNSPKKVVYDAEYWEKMYEQEYARIAAEHANDPGFPVGAHATAKVWEMKENQEYIDKYSEKEYNDNFWGQTAASFRRAKIAEKKSDLYNEYLTTGNEADLQLAKNMSELAGAFEQNNLETLRDDATLPWISQTMAGYAPQLVRQTGARAVGGLTGATIGGAMGNPVAGAAVGMSLAASADMYNSMRGQIFGELLEMGVDEEVARKAANDEAIVSSAIEGADALGDAFTFGTTSLIKALGKGAVKGTAKTAGKEIAKTLLKYGINIGQEYGEEWLQEGVSVANERRAKTGETGVLDLAKDSGNVAWGAITSTEDDETRARMHEAGTEGAKIGAMMGFVPNAISVGVNANNMRVENKVGKTYKADELIAEGLELDENSEAHKVAERLQAKQNAGQKISNAELVEAIRANERAIAQETQPATLEEAAQMRVAETDGARKNTVASGVDLRYNEGSEGSVVNGREDETGNGTGDRRGSSEVLSELEKEGLGRGSEIREDIHRGTLSLKNEISDEKISETDIVEPAEGSVGQYAKMQADEYNVPCHIVSDEAFTRAGIKADAYSRDGQIYIRESADDRKRDAYIPHEASHVMKQTGYAPYMEFVGNLPEKVNMSSQNTRDELARVAKHRGFENIDLTSKQAVDFWDEFNATVYGTIQRAKAQGVDYTEYLGEIFHDLDGYVAGMDSLHNDFKAHNKKNAPASVVRSAPFNVMSNEAVDARRTREAGIRSYYGFGEHGARTLADVMDSMPVDSFATRAFSAAYMAGRTNLSPELAELKTELQIKAFEAGLRDYNAETKSKEENVKNVVSHGKKAGFDSKGKPADATNTQMKIVDDLYKAMGVKGSLADGLLGNAELKTNIGISPIARDFQREIEVDGEKRKVSIVYHAAHEIAMHRLMELAPKEGQAFINALYRHMNVDSVKSLAEAKREAYAAQGVKISLSEAMEEVAANQILALYNWDEAKFAEAVDRIVNGKNEQAKQGASKFKQILDSVIAKLKSIIAKLNPKERQEVQAELDEFAELRDLFEKAFAAAVAKNKEIAAQQTTAQKSTAGAVKHSIRRGFAAEIDAWDGTKNTIFNIGTTSKALQSIGVEDRKIIWHGKKIAEILRKHKNMTRDVIKQVPEIMENPIIVLKSMQSDSRVTMFGEVSDAVGNPILAVLELEPTKKGGELLDMNVVASAYGKESKPANFIKNSELLYLDPNKNRTGRWLNAVGLQLPSVASTHLGSIGTITYIDGKVNIKGVPYEQYMQGVENNAGKSSQKRNADSRGHELTAEQAQYFSDSKVRDENGNLLVMYQGSENDFTVFDRKKSKYSNLYGRGFYFTKSESHAKQYGNTKAYYLDIKNPVSTTETTITKAQMKKFLEAVAENEDYGIENYGYGATPESVLNSLYGKTDFLMLNDVSQTAIGDLVEAIELFNEVNGTEFDGIILDTETVTFRSEQAKLMGNENPTANPDIRFSLKQPVEESYNLIALHNSTAEKLLEALKLGGLPAPSIAITKNDMLHENFGDISLVFRKDSISPTDRRNKIYSGDAYTPTRVRVEYDVDDDILQEFNKRLKELTPEWSAERLPSVDSGTAEVENDSLYTAYERNDRAKFAFLREKGKAPKIAMRTPIVSTFVSNDTVIALAKSFSAKQLSDIANTSEGVKQYKNAFLKVIRDTEDSRAVATGIYSADEASLFDIAETAREAKKVKENKYKIKKEIDLRATFELIDKKFTKSLETEYREWIDENTKDAIIDKGIRNNRDLFTPSGQRRTFKQLHEPYNLGNIIKQMFSGEDKGVALFGGSPVGAAQREYSSIADVKADSDRLQQLEQEEYDKIRDQIEGDVFELARKMQINSDVFAVRDLLSEAIGKKTKQQADAVLKRETQVGGQRWAKYSPAFTDELWDIRERILNMPTGYFEAKPQRAVNFNEVALVVMPKGMTTLRKQLENAGVQKVVYYDKSKDGDRLAKVNSVEDAKFSLKDSDYMDAVNKGDMETAQKMVDEAAKEAGYTIKGLHSTNAEFTVFDIDKTSEWNDRGKGIYFTSSSGDLENNYENYEGPDPWQKVEARAYELADEKYGLSYEDTLTSDPEIVDQLNECYDEAIEEFEKTRRRITAYLKLDNPLVLDNNTPFPSDYNREDYDGIIDKTVYGRFGHNGMDENTVHYIVFNPRNIKSADAVTYDDNGNIIPLSERFKIDNNDIRYSLKDSDYEAAPYDMTAIMKESTIDKYLADYASKGSPNYAQAYIAYMTPYQFLKLTTSDGARLSEIQKQSRKLDKAEFEEATHYQPIYLRINHETGEVEGHEGRHRMVALEGEGINNVPVLLFDSSNKDSKKAIAELSLTGQFNELRTATVTEAIPFNFANRELIIEKFGTQSSMQRVGERLGIRNTFQYSLRNQNEVSLQTMTNVRKAISDNDVTALAKYAEKGVISTEYYNQLVEQYGAIPKGENPHRDVAVPQKTEKNKKVSQTVRTILEAKATPDEAVPTIEKMVEDGIFSYDVYTDKQAIADAEKKLRDEGWTESYNEWLNAVNKGKVTKDTTVTGWALYNNAANIAATTTSETERRTAIQTSLEILDAMVRHQRSAAQALQATRILKKLSPETQLYGVQKSVQSLQRELEERYGDKAPDLKIDEDLAEEFLNAKTQEERDAAEEKILKDIGRQMPSRFIDRWNAWRYLAMLGNARTHVRNVGGNAGFAPIVAVKNLTATAIESAVYRLSGKKTARSKAFVGGSKADRALLAAAWKDYANVSDMISNGGKYSDFAMANQTIEEGRQIFKTKPLEWARKGNSKLLEMEDMWFSKPHYAYALAQYCKANNITAEQLKRGKALGAARQYAIKEAQKATYRDTNEFSQMVSGWGRGNKNEKNLAKKAFNTVVEGILPFRKTPANILVRGVEYSPIGLLKGLSVDLYRASKGEITSAEAIDNISAGLTGTGLLALGVYLAAQGLIRGHGEDDEEKEFKELMGHQAYALELPNGTSVTLDWLAPEALPFFVGVNIWETTKGKKEELNFSTILQIVSGITEPMLEMSCLQGLNDLFESVGYASSNDMSGLLSVASSAATSYLMQGIPTILGQAERTGEENRMATYTEKNAFLTRDMQYTLGKVSAKIPGLDYHQIPYIDAWGRKEASGNALKRGLNNFLNPAYTSTIETSSMEKELLRLYEKTGEGGVFPERADKYFTVDGKRKDLTAEEYVKYATLKGKKSYELVSDLVKSKAYKNLSNEEKAEAIKEAYDYANQKAKKSVANYKPEKWVTVADKFGDNVGNFISFRTEVSSQRDDNGGKISKQEVVDIALDMAQSDSEIWDMYLSEYNSKADVHLHEFGIEGEDYMSIIKKLDVVDQPNKSGKLGTYTNDEIAAAISMVRGLSGDERAELWQSMTGSTSTKNNPWR